MSEWIPVSERLPEKDGTYLCTSRWDSEDDYGVEMLDFGDTVEDCVHESWTWNGKGFGEEWSDGIDNIHDVIAWMPLPDPYIKAEAR